jgi:hypothetical protein
MVKLRSFPGVEVSIVSTGQPGQPGTHGQLKSLNEYPDHEHVWKENAELDPEKRSATWLECVTDASL